MSDATLYNAVLFCKIKWQNILVSLLCCQFTARYLLCNYMRIGRINLTSMPNFEVKYKRGVKAREEVGAVLTDRLYEY